MRNTHDSARIGQNYILTSSTVFGGGEGQIPGFSSKNARSENRRKFLHRNGQRGGDGIQPEY
jgi:hypothetical protein